MKGELIPIIVSKVRYIRQLNQLDNQLQEVANEKKRKEAEKKAEADKIYLEKSFALINYKTFRVINAFA